MACELLQREFTNSAGDNVLVVVRQLSASKALSLHAELVSKLGNRFLPFVENKYNFGDILSMMQIMDNEAFSEFFKRVISSHVTMEGQEVKPALYDMQFNGEMMLACKIFGFVLESNYLSFFKQGLALNEQRRLEAEEASTPAEPKNPSPEKT